MSAAAQGSPLCGVALTGDAGSACDPDNGACTPPASPATASLDAAVSPEAADGGDAGVGRFGCRVTAVHAEAGVVSVAPVCKAAGDGKNESTCQGSSDCAPGFECVVDASRTHADGAATSGVCRRYCCDNICPGERSFCDIETTLGGSIAVPVCVARPATVAPDGGAPCELLNDTSCGAVGLACQVVNPDTGQVACVTPGTATAGQSCEVQKCAKGLSCILGYFPERRCAQLCNDDRDDCPSGQTCAPNAELSSVNAGIGVCSP